MLLASPRSETCMLTRAAPRHVRITQHLDAYNTCSVQFEQRWLSNAATRNRGYVEPVMPMAETVAPGSIQMKSEHFLVFLRVQRRLVSVT